MACKTLHNIANTWIPCTNLERFSLEVAIKRSQCHRITFQDARIELQDTVANKSRVAVIAALLRRLREAIRAEEMAAERQARLNAFAALTTAR